MPFLPERFYFGMVLVSKAAQQRQCVSAVSASELCASCLTLHRTRFALQESEWTASSVNLREMIARSGKE